MKRNLIVITVYDPVTKLSDITEDVCGKTSEERAAYFKLNGADISGRKTTTCKSHDTPDQVPEKFIN